jgi:hypothetical protein
LKAKFKIPLNIKNSGIFYDTTDACHNLTSGYLSNVSIRSNLPAMAVSSNLALRERKGALDMGFGPDPMRRPSKA